LKIANGKGKSGGCLWIELSIAGGGRRLEIAGGLPQFPENRKFLSELKKN
jgi:hypothetical protein